MTSENAPARARRIALLLEYDGTAFSGSQYQENGRTVQAELEAAINNLTGERVRAAFAGRTDAGVHAMGQVAAFGTSKRLPAAAAVRGLNHFLPEDVAVRDAVEAAPEFDPRRDAESRRYRYLIARRRERPALLRGRVWHVSRALDIETMRRAARMLEGAHDFAAFAGPYDGPTRRTLRRCEVASAGECLRIEMEAEAFLPHQVRRTVGALVEVGSGRMSEEALVRLLEEAKPATAGPSAPACGLYLVSVAYDGLRFGAGETDGTDEHVHTEARRY
ncbi:MAG TPA: tRNA pseudouridine(38-40) synthase TruA [Dehalococcoidia bacterium]|nr:tRNA pseudouridine(38-40) synthase TruA [Dehalococcoidia bacterium]